MNKQNKNKQTNNPKYLNGIVIFWVTKPVTQKKKVEENQKLN